MTAYDLAVLADRFDAGTYFHPGSIGEKKTMPGAALKARQAGATLYTRSFDDKNRAHGAGAGRAAGWGGGAGQNRTGSGFCNLAQI
jgi:hypothetical protein